MHNPEASQCRPASVPRQPYPAHAGRKPVRARARPRPERRPKADSVRTEQEEPAGAVRHAEPFARSGRIAAPQTGRSARRGTAENQPLPRRVHTRQGRSGTGSSPPRECGPQCGEGGERNGRRSFGSLRDGTKYIRSKFMPGNSGDAFHVKNATHRNSLPLGNGLGGNAANRFRECAWTSGNLFRFQTRFVHIAIESISFFHMQASLSVKGALSCCIIQP